MITRGDNYPEIFREEGCALKHFLTIAILITVLNTFGQVEPCTNYACDSSVIAEIEALYLHTYITTDTLSGRIISVNLDIWAPDEPSIITAVGAALIAQQTRGK